MVRDKLIAEPGNQEVGIRGADEGEGAWRNVEERRMCGPGQGAGPIVNTAY